MGLEVYACVCVCDRVCITQVYPRARAVSEFGWQSYSNLASLAEVFGPSGFGYWSPDMARRDTHASQPQPVILFHNVGTNWLIPGYDAPSPADPDARNNRLVGNALAAARCVV